MLKGMNTDHDEEWGPVRLKTGWFELIFILVLWKWVCFLHAICNWGCHSDPYACDLPVPHTHWVLRSTTWTNWPSRIADSWTLTDGIGLLRTALAIKRPLSPTFDYWE